MSDYYKNKTVLVTGSAGFVGTNICLELLKKGAKVIGTWHNRKPRIENENFEAVKVDLTVREECMKITKKIDFVIMTAAFVGGAESMLAYPMQFVTDTTVMNLYILEAAYQNRVKKVLYISSGMVYPESKEPLTEERGLEGEPFEKYFFGGWSRRYTEVVCRMYAEKLKEKMPVVIVRVDNIYGPYDSFKWEKSHVMAASIRKAVERMNPYEIWGDGKDYKDFTYIKDLVYGALLALEKTDAFDVFNIASGTNYTVDEVIRTICRLDGFDDVQFTYNTSKPMMIPYKKVSIEKAKQELGYSPKYSLEEGIKETLKWYRNNQEQ